MRVAVTVWDNRVSPVFDSSHMLLVGEVSDADITNREYVPFDPQMPSSLAKALAGLDVSTLICGAVSEQLANVIEGRKIRLIPFITGDADEVLETYAKNTAFDAGFFMPGCGPSRGGKKKHRRTGTIQGKGADTMGRRNGSGSRGANRRTGTRATGNGKGGRGQGRGRGRAKGGSSAMGTGRSQNFTPQKQPQRRSEW